MDNYLIKILTKIMSNIVNIESNGGVHGDRNQITENRE